MKLIIYSLIISNNIDQFKNVFFSRKTYKINTLTKVFSSSLWSYIIDIMIRLWDGDDEILPDKDSLLEIKN